MNILIPDLWLREFLDTNAKPHDIFQYLSLCGPSVERYEEVQGDTVYDIEITTNRIDAFSVYGIAREAAVILPQFGFKATLKPVSQSKILAHLSRKPKLDIAIVNDPALCNRILAIKMTGVTLGPSPEWMIRRLEQVGLRGLNNAIDITNYVAHEFGYGLHAFDYDRLTDKKIIVRLAEKGEKLTTLDHKKITLEGGEIVFDNGKGEIIDLPGIMGTANTVVTDETKNVLLFNENADGALIRRASMLHALRSHAAIINEKYPDPVFAQTAFLRALELYETITGAAAGSTLVDIFPNKPEKHRISVSGGKIAGYIGIDLAPGKILSVLGSLGFTASYDKNKNIFTAEPPSYRAHDVQIPEDIIEEIARIYGYHNIPTRLPDTEPPVTVSDPTLVREEDIKIRLRDWGYTETYTYSMISEELMDIFHLDKTRAYKITNPLSQEWVYLRPYVLPGMLAVLKQNLAVTPDLKLFELSMAYQFREGDLPQEKPILVVLWTGKMFFEAKGLAEAIFDALGIPFPKTGEGYSGNIVPFYGPVHYALGEFGSVGEVDPVVLGAMGIPVPVTQLYLEFDRLVASARPARVYRPVPKYPPLIEDYSFIVPDKFQVGPLLEAIRTLDPLILTANLADSYEHSRTIRVSYLDPTKNLRSEEVTPIREKLLDLAAAKFHTHLKE